MKELMTNEEKIKKINSDRKIMLEKVKKKISNNNTSDSITELFEIICYDEENTKEYKAILEAKKMIADLTKKISESTSVEEIVDIRKKVNYYINKIKKILISRGVDEAQIEKFSENVSYMRKDISKYIRFLKREKNIEEIIKLNSNIVSLSEEDKSRLKRLLKNEVSYIKRNQESDYNSTKNNDINSSFFTDMLLINQAIIEEEKNPTSSLSINDGFKKLENETKNISSNLIESSEEIKLEEMINNYMDKFESLRKTYHLKELSTYNNSFIKNLINLIRNIPSYIYNNKIIKIMEFDFYNYYRGDDFNLYIKYAKEKNSIKNAIEFVFKNSRLSKREAECFNIHNESVEWLEKNLSQGEKYYCLNV